MKMKRSQATLLALFMVFALKAECADTAPLKLVTMYEFPSDVKGNFDHLTADVRGHRLFLTLREHKSVNVVDLRNGRLIQSMPVGNPHVVLYREDLRRLYVTDEDAGELKIFDAKTYQLIKNVKLLVGADAMGYDPATKYAYVVNGGGNAKMSYSVISIIDTMSGEKVDDIKLDGASVESMAFEKSSPKMYVNNRTKNRVEVIDRNARRVLTSWPLTLGDRCGPITLDEPDHRLFVACRSGHIVVLGTETGKELQALPIGERVDDLAFDPTRKRLYAACGGGTGTVDVYKEIDPDHYQSLGKVPSGPVGKNGCLVPELNRYFVPVPQHEGENAEILVYQVR
jgi:DNA-binding beta-propeller fold protein YncE